MWASVWGAIFIRSGAASEGERAASLRGVVLSLVIFVTLSTGPNGSGPKSSIAAKMRRS